MPSWEKLQQAGSLIGENLPGKWILSDPPPFWMIILTSDDQLARILIDVGFVIMVEISSDGKPLPPMGSDPSKRNSSLTRIKTRHRDPLKIASMLAQRFKLSEKGALE